MLSRRRLLQGLSLVALHVPQTAHAQAYKAEYRISLVSPPGTLWYQTAERFSKLVNERSQGRIKFKLYPGSSLVQGQQDRELVALRQGLIDCIVGTAGNYAGTVKELIVFNMPFLMRNNMAVDAVLASEVLQGDFYDILRKAGVETLASGEYGYVHIMNSRRRVVVPDDLKGLKIRTVGTPMQGELMSALGANPTTMPFSELQPALATGAVDGLALTMEQFVAVKAHTLGIKHITKWNAWNELIHVMISNNVWRAWTPEDQQIVREAAKEATRELTANVRKAAANGDDTVKSLGVDVAEPSKAQMELWQTAAQPVFDRWKVTLGPELVTKIESAVAAALRQGESK
ncbi:TRAP transporter substrate-binding protein DctP [Bradyrhizobium sp. 200]|uniref:TRAP transporter substrate-binding protein n=1 Tax=Bradyrhizobium sp. 200 TaxID=2782665 RepID=UPI001FFF5236|nr:TRAP transporter substrate-binding protein DctP [Bradyrhizobium sp. 200]UPJ48416.1 TRAP transporter substrate-binding protein DctP [Bradyrhizobium sp. 200]